MKKVLCFLLIAIVLAGSLALVGCKKTDEPPEEVPEQPPETSGQVEDPVKESPPPKNLMEMVAANPLFFTDKDLEFLDIKLWDSEEKLLSLMGEPAGVEEGDRGQFDNMVYYWEYEDLGFIRMEPERIDGVEQESYIIGSITVINEKVAGPRGIKIGDHYLEVIKKFYIDESMPDMIWDFRRFLYAYPDDTMFISGRLEYDQDAADEVVQYLIYNFTPFDENDEFLGLGYSIAFTIEDEHIVSFGLRKQWTNRSW